MTTKNAQIFRLCLKNKKNGPGHYGLLQVLDHRTARHLQFKLVVRQRQIQGQLLNCQPQRILVLRPFNGYFHREFHTALQLIITVLRPRN